MQIFFQSFLPIVRAIESLIEENKKPKISLKQDALHFTVVKKWEEGEEEKSAMEFFLFLKKRIAALDVAQLPMGEREALLETVSILERYIEVFLVKGSKVESLLQKELFSLRIGGIVPRKYINDNHEDVKFILINQLDRILFYHGIALKFHPVKGISFPVKGSQGTVRDIYYSDLKIFSLDLMVKYYYNGEFLFSTDRDGFLLETLTVEDHALTTHNAYNAFIVYRSGFPEPSLEINRRDGDLYVALHDGRGSVFRFGVDDMQLVSPDRFAYSDDKGFEKIVIPGENSSIDLCIEGVYQFHFKTVDDLVVFLLNCLELNDCVSYVTSQNKLMSYFQLPKVIYKAVRGETSWSNVFKPWKALDVNYSLLEQKGDELRKRSVS